ncbi:hypothetical protein CHU98_g8855 [Xylaria longipes]|nr:hypothetical protein CHU98_g8855 [Xylaria longipes]
MRSSHELEVYKGLLEPTSVFTISLTHELSYTLTLFVREDVPRDKKGWPASPATETLIDSEHPCAAPLYRTPSGRAAHAVFYTVFSTLEIMEQVAANHGIGISEFRAPCVDDLWKHKVQPPINFEDFQ